MEPRKFRTYNPSTKEEREYTTDAPCTKLILMMFDVAMQRLAKEGITKEYMAQCHLEALVPSPKFVHDVIKDWVDDKITQEEAHKLVRDEAYKLVESWHESIRNQEDG